MSAPDTASASSYGQRTLTQGMSGPDVAKMQRLLRRTGARLTADGAFGPMTASALRRFEASAGLTADGRLTVAEARALRRAARGLDAGASGETERDATAVRRQSAAADDSPFAGGATPQDEVAPVDEPEPAAAPDGDDDGVFPIRGRHDLGQSPTNHFGGGRGHQGHDMFARCGTPVVAARSGKVTAATFQSAAGNYVVITDRRGRSAAYMHLQRPASVARGERVRAGQRIGEVGATGRATGCHLHFELWTAPGWYQGGKPVDPLPTLRRWDRAS